MRTGEFKKTSCVAAHIRDSLTKADMCKIALSHEVMLTDHLNLSSESDANVELGSIILIY